MSVAKAKKHDVPEKLAPKNLKKAKWVYQNGVMTNLNADHNAKKWAEFIGNGFKDKE